MGNCSSTDNVGQPVHLPRVDHQDMQVDVSAAANKRALAAHQYISQKEIKVAQVQKGTYEGAMEQTDTIPTVLQDGLKEQRHFKKRCKSRLMVVGETADIRTVYEFEDIIGKGQFGTTRHAIHKNTGKSFACKSISKRKLHFQEEIEDLKREVEILHHLSGHPNIVKVQGLYEDVHFVHIVMDLASGGELFDRIVQKGSYSERDAATAFRTMVAVVAHMHQLNVVHRDLKPENFLLQSSCENSEILACDFGVSTFWKEGQSLSDLVGTAFYMAPEVLHKSYGKEADIWSLGVILYILLSGVPPFYGETEAAIFKEILYGDLDLESHPWPHVSQEAKSLVQQLLNRNSSERLTATQILDNHWVLPGGCASAVPIQSEVVKRLQGFAAMNRLKKEAVKLICMALPEHEIRGLREMFQAIDTDGSGHITVTELRQALQKKGAGSIGEEELQQLVALTDGDGNGTLDWEEFLAATIHQSRLIQEEHLLSSFKQLDPDGSGYIDKEELLKALGPKVSPEEAQKLLDQVDTDGSGTIDYQEFVAMMMGTTETGVEARKARRAQSLTHVRK